MLFIDNQAKQHAPTLAVVHLHLLQGHRGLSSDIKITANVMLAYRALTF